MPCGGRELSAFVLASGKSVVTVKYKVTEGVGSWLEPCSSWFGLHLKISGKSLEGFKLDKWILA